MVCVESGCNPVRGVCRVSIVARVVESSFANPGAARVFVNPVRVFVSLLRLNQVRVVIILASRDMLPCCTVLIAKSS